MLHLGIGVDDIITAAQTIKFPTVLDQQWLLHDLRPRKNWFATCTIRHLHDRSACFTFH